MATTSLGRAVTSTLELLAGYSYHPSSESGQNDPALRPLQPLGDAAIPLMDELKALRRQKCELTEQLERQKSATELYAATLSELISRVRALPQDDIAAKLLAGIDMPAEGDVSQAVLSMLQSSIDLRVEARSFISPGRAAIPLEDRVELPIINAYLDRAWETAKKSVNTYAKLELTEEPTILKAWPNIEENLKSQLSEIRPLTEYIRIKAEALNALKTAENISIEEALIGSLRLKSRLESMISESESWVVTEIFHERIPSTPQLHSRIDDRIRLINEPLTLKTLKEIGDIYEEYENLRKLAVLRPWIEKVQPELEWWKLVNLAKQVIDASEENYRMMQVERGSEWEYRPALDRLQRESTIDTEGIYNFLFSLLEELRKLENLKKDCINLISHDSLRDSVIELLHSYITFSMIFATFGDQPCQDFLHINSQVNHADCDIPEVIQSLKILTKNLLTASTQRLTEKLSANWLTPILKKCMEITPEEDTEGRTRLDIALNFVETEGQETSTDYTDNLENVKECIVQTFENLFYENTQQRELLEAELRTKDEELEQERAKKQASVARYDALVQMVDASVAILKTGYTNLYHSENEGLKSTSSQLEHQTMLALSSLDKAKLFGSSATTLFSALSGIDSYQQAEAKSAAQRLTAVQAAADQQVVSSVAAVYSSLESEVNAVYPPLTQLLETVDKPALIVEGNRLLVSGTDPQHHAKAISDKLKFFVAAISVAEAVVRERLSGAESVTLIRKLKQALEESGKHAEELSKGTAGPENEAKTKETVQIVRAKAEESGVGDLVEALVKTQELERQQMELRLADDYKGAEVVAEAIEPPVPAQRLSASVPTSHDKLEKGMDFLVRTVDSMLGELNTQLQEDVRRGKLAEIEEAVGYERLLLQETLIHAELTELQKVVKGVLERRFEKGLEALAKLVSASPEGPERAQLTTAYASLERDKQTNSKSLLMLTEDVDSLIYSQLRAVPVPQARPVVDAPKKLVASVERLLAVYENELPLHSIQLLCTSDEERIMKEGDTEMRAIAHLEVMEKGLKALSEKANVTKQELKKTKDHVFSNSEQILDAQMHTVRTLSEEDSTGYWAAQSPMEDNLKKALKASIHIRDFTVKLYERLKMANGLVGKQDVLAHINFLLEREKLHSSIEVPVSEVSSQPLDIPAPTRLQGIPSKPNPFTGLDKSVRDAMESGFKVLLLHGLDSLVANGRRNASVSVTEGDPIGIMKTKLEFLKDSLDHFCLHYSKNVFQPWVAVFDLSKKNLNTARNLLKDAAKKQQVGATLDQLANRANTNRGELRDCSEAVERKIEQVLEELRLDWAGQFQEAGEETATEGVASERKKLSAIPGAAEKGAKGMDLLLATAGQMMIVLQVPEEPQFQETQQRADTASGQEKLLLQQSLLNLKLNSMLDAMRYHFQCLTDRLIADVRELGKTLSVAEETEPVLLEVESGASENGANISMITSLEDLLKCLLAEMPASSVHMAAPADNPRTKLSAIPTISDRISRGLAFTLSDLDSLAVLLSASEDPSRPTRAAEVEAAAGLDKVHLQQTLVHRVASQVIGRTKELFADVLQRLITDSRLIAGQTGNSQMMEDLDALEQEAQREGVQASDLFSLLEELETQIRNIAASAETPEEKERTRLSAVAKGGDKLAKGLDYLMGMVGDLMLILGLAGEEPERIAQLRQISDFTGQEKLLTQQCLLYADLKSCRARLLSRLSSMNSQLSALAPKLTPFIATEPAITAFTAAFRDIDKMALGVPASIDQPARACDLLSQLSFVLPLSHSEFVETGSAGDECAPQPVLTKKLSAVQNSTDKLSQGMIIILKEVGWLHSRLEQEPDEEVAEQLEEIEASSGLEKVILQQAFIRSELIRAQEGLNDGLDRTLEKLVTALRPLHLSEDQQKTVSELSTIVRAKFSDICAAEDILFASISQAVHYEEAQDEEVMEDPSEPERTKLSAVPNAGDKVGKGMDFLMKATGRLMGAMKIEMDLSGQLQAIGRATGQDKILMQQGLLNTELKEILQAVQRLLGSDSGFEETGVSSEPSSGPAAPRSKLKAGSSDDLTIISEQSILLCSVFRAVMKPEAVSLIEDIKTAALPQKPSLQGRLTLLNFQALKERATAIQTEQQAETGERNSVNGMVTRLKVGIETAFGPEFSEDWKRVATGSVHEKLKTLANWVEKIPQKLRRYEEEINRLLPLLRAITFPAIQSRLCPSPSPSLVLELCSLSLQSLTSAYEQGESNLRRILSDIGQLATDMNAIEKTQIKEIRGRAETAAAGGEKLTCLQQAISSSLGAITAKATELTEKLAENDSLLTATTGRLIVLLVRTDSLCGLLIETVKDEDSGMQADDLMTAFEEVSSKPAHECMFQLTGLLFNYHSLCAALAAKLYCSDSADLVQEMELIEGGSMREVRERMQSVRPTPSSLEILDRKLTDYLGKAINAVVYLTNGEETAVAGKATLAKAGLPLLESIREKVDVSAELLDKLGTLQLMSETSSETHIQDEVKRDESLKLLESKDQIIYQMQQEIDKKDALLKRQNAELAELTELRQESSGNKEIRGNLQLAKAENEHLKKQLEDLKAK